MTPINQKFGEGEQSLGVCINEILLYLILTGILILITVEAGCFTTNSFQIK